jgi:hypothetical protein
MLKHSGNKGTATATTHIQHSGGEEEIGDGIVYRARPSFLRILVATIFFSDTGFAPQFSVYLVIQFLYDIRSAPLRPESQYTHLAARIPFST